MDISDGLAGDLTKMLQLAGLSARIRFANIPLSKAARAALAAVPHLYDTILSGGDDYEILCTISPVRAESFERTARAAEVDLTRIGVAEASAKPGVHFTDEDGRAVRLDRLSYSHV